MSETVTIPQTLPHISELLLRDQQFTTKKWQVNRHLKRLLDLVGATLGLILSSPVMLLISLLIKSTSRGPVLFKQQRIGCLGKPFTFFKFRTMSYDCPVKVHRDHIINLIKSRKPVCKLTDDTRITRVGRFLRIWSLDELPQLFNVLRGEMSLIGPRPAIPYEVANYRLWHLQRMDVIPGITGLWQVKGRSQTTFDEMVRLDIQYIRNWSWWLDIKILWQTCGAVISRKGAL